MNLLRIEGVNHAHCIDDTEDLSTRRGGSLMLLHATRLVERALHDRLEAITTAASVGLFRIKDSMAPEEVADAVRQLMTRHATLRHGTFMVSTASGEDEAAFRPAEVRALNRGRWQQMQTLSFATAGLRPTQAGACTLDRVRPVADWCTVAAQAETGVSLSVAERRAYGLRQKQRFYRHELEQLGPVDRPGWLDEELRYTFDFARLADDPVDPADQLLAGKLAVFYADGNGFGRHARACRSAAEVSQWEEHLKRERRLFLKRLIERARRERRWQTRDGVQRLETLLWGGDECLFVVPAWCGFELVQLFFAATADLRYPPDDRAESARLTHACGLVFCHQGAPISRISALVKALAEQGKQDGKAHDSLNWLVLESFDHAGGDLAEYLKQRFPAVAVEWRQLAFRPETLEALLAALPTLKDALPHAAMVRAARLLAAGVTEHALLQRSYLQITAELSPDQLLRWRSLWSALHPARADWADQPAAADLPVWVQLLETWDYVVSGVTGAGKETA